MVVQRFGQRSVLGHGEEPRCRERVKAVEVLFAKLITLIKQNEFLKFNLSSLKLHKFVFLILQNIQI